MNQHEFKELLGGFIPVPVEDVFEEYVKVKDLHFYHLMCSVADFKFLWSCQEFKFYSLCRCHQVADDGSTAHEHIHAVVSCRVLLDTWKRQIRRKQIRLYKTTFKKIICADHLCGVFRYICCRDGQRIGKRGADGLVLSPHTHYDRKVDVRGWVHQAKGRICGQIRREIEVKMKLKVNEPLHDFDSCQCDNSRIGNEKREEANRKRKAFYETEAGKEVKERYKKKKLAKDEVINKLIELGKVGTKAELLRKEMERLMKML
jgi:hypothetical protein